MALPSGNSFRANSQELWMSCRVRAATEPCKSRRANGSTVVVPKVTIR